MLFFELHPHDEVHPVFKFILCPFLKNVILIRILFKFVLEFGILVLTLAEIEYQAPNVFCF